MNAYLVMFLFIIGIFGLLLFCFKFVCFRGEWHCRSGRSRGYWGGGGGGGGGGGDCGGGGGGGDCGGGGGGD